MNGFFILLLVICLLFSLQFVIAVMLFRKSNVKEINGVSGSGSLVVVIPFRNESDRIMPLLHSINKQHPFSSEIQFVFCNDHSDDNSVETIQQIAAFPFQLIELNEVSGKKAAIHQAVQATNAEYILTLDADVMLPENYFKNLLKILTGDLIILPVEMSSKTLIQKLGSIEFEWLQKLTFGSAKPVLCNGANLVFKRSAYLEIFDQRTDQNIASGDDAFLLYHMMKQNKQVNRINLRELEVTTPAPLSALDLFTQRKRWAGKLGQMKNTFFILPGVLLMLVELSFIVCFICGYFYPLLFVLPILKFLSELILISDLKKRNLIPALIIHQFWYPLYLIRMTFPVKTVGRWNQVEKSA